MTAYAAFTQNIIGAVALALITGSATAANPVTDTWHFDKSSLGRSADTLASHFGYTYSGKDTGHKVKASGWYADDWKEDIINADGGLTHWGGGISLNRANDHHSTDNRHEYEFVLFEFEKPVSLQSFQYGWINGDSDTSIMYYDEALASSNGNSVANQSFGDKAGASIKTSGSNRTELKFDDVTEAPFGSSYGADSLTKRGFKLLNGGGGDADGATAFANPGKTDTPTTVGQNAGSSVFSYLWAIGADFFETNADHFDGGKLKLVSATWQEGTPSTGVPLPGTLALLALGGLFLRRNRASQN